MTRQNCEIDQRGLLYIAAVQQQRYVEIREPSSQRRT